MPSHTNAFSLTVFGQPPLLESWCFRK